MIPLTLAFVLLFTGLALLSVGINKHCQALVGRALARSQQYAAQALGAGLLVLALAVCITQWQASVGATLWTGILTFAALTLAATFAWCSRRLQRAITGFALATAAILLLIFY